MSSISKELAELLVDNGLLSDADLEQVEQEKEKTGEPLRIILERLQLATEKQLKNTLELQYGVNYLALHTINPDLNVVDLLPSEVISDHGVVPIQLDGNRLTVAMINPDSGAAMKAIKASVSMDIKPLVCFEDDFQIFLSQIEKMRHMPDRAVAPIDDSEFGVEEELEAPAAEPADGSADDTTETADEIHSEGDFEVEPADEEQPEEVDSEAAVGDETTSEDASSVHEAVTGLEYEEQPEGYPGDEQDIGDVTSDNLTPSVSLSAGAYSAQYDTGSLDSIATPRVDADELNAIPTPGFNASDLDSIPAPKAEAAPPPPPEKPQLGGFGALFGKGKDKEPRKAASDPVQERSGGMSALRGMMGGKKGGPKKSEPAPSPPPPKPAPAVPPLNTAGVTESQEAAAITPEEIAGKTGLLSSKLGSAAHSTHTAKKFFKEKRTESQPIAPQEAQPESAVPEWMNQIDENTPIEPKSDEQAVAEYYQELGFDSSAEDAAAEMEEPAAEADIPVDESAQEGAGYEIPPMDPGAASFMSFTGETDEQTAPDGQAATDALAEASEALAASTAAVEEALAGAEEAWEEASAAAEEAVASSDSLPKFVPAE